MGANIALLLMVIIVVGSITMAAIVHRRAEREARRRKMVRLHAGLCRRHTHALAALTACDPDPELATFINGARIGHAERILQWSPGHPDGMTLLADAQGFEHQLLPPGQSGMKWPQVLEGLNEAAALLQEMHARGKVDMNRFNSWVGHLKGLYLCAEVDAAADRAEVAHTRGDNFRAQLEYRNALTRILQTDEALPGREERIQHFQACLDELSSLPVTRKAESGETE